MNITTYDTLPATSEFISQWNELANGNPLKSYQWLATWWKHYGRCDASKDTDRELFVVVASGDTAGEDSKAGAKAILPCYVETSLLRGRVLRLLGDGEVCTDHSGLITNSDSAAKLVATTLAERADWDAIHFESIDEQDHSTRAIFAELEQLGMQTSSSAAEHCWAIELPDEYEDFLACQSKSHRKQLRRAERRLADDGAIRWQLVRSASEFDDAWSILTDLHQRRRESLGEPGCFASPLWAAFHHDVAKQLLDANQLRLSILWHNNSPLAAEYHLAGAATTHAYQGGVEPDRLDHEPGRLSLICAIQHAISEGHTKFDLMRGNEPYKPHWRAKSQPTVDLIAVAPRALSRLRDGARTGLLAARATAKRFVGKAN